MASRLEKLDIEVKYNQSPTRTIRCENDDLEFLLIEKNSEHVSDFISRKSKILVHEIFEKNWYKVVKHRELSQKLIFGGGEIFEKFHFSGFQNEVSQFQIRLGRNVGVKSDIGVKV